MKFNGKMTFLIGQENTIIEIYDDDSSRIIMHLTLTPNQLSSALSRLSHTKIECSEILNTDKIGKKMEIKRFVFELPKESNYSNKKKIALDLVKEKCPKGWEADNYFGSQDSFFEKDGKKMARVIIRRWV